MCRTAEQCATSPAREQSVTEHFVTQFENTSLWRTSNIIPRCCGVSANSASRHKCQDFERKGKEGKGREGKVREEKGREGKERKGKGKKQRKESMPYKLQSAQTWITQLPANYTMSPSAAGRSLDREVRRPKTDVLPLCHATTLAGRPWSGRETHLEFEELFALAGGQVDEYVLAVVAGSVSLDGLVRVAGVSDAVDVLPYHHAVVHHRVHHLLQPLQTCTRCDVNTPGVTGWSIPRHLTILGVKAA